MGVDKEPDETPEEAPKPTDAPTPADAIKNKMDRRQEKKEAERDPREGFNLEQRIALDKIGAAVGPFLIVTPSTGHVYVEGFDAETAKLSTLMIYGWLTQVAQADLAATQIAMKRAREAAAARGGPVGLRRSE